MDDDRRPRRRALARPRLGHRLDRRPDRAEMAARGLAPRVGQRALVRSPRAGPPERRRRAARRAPPRPALEPRPPRAGPPLRRAHAAQKPGVHPRRRYHSGPRHRRHHRHLQHRQHRPVAPAAVRRFRTPGAALGDQPGPRLDRRRMRAGQRRRLAARQPVVRADGRVLRRGPRAVDLELRAHGRRRSRTGEGPAGHGELLRRARRAAGDRPRVSPAGRIRRRRRRRDPRSGIVAAPFRRRSGDRRPHDRARRRGAHGRRRAARRIHLRQQPDRPVAADGMDAGERRRDAPAALPARHRPPQGGNDGRAGAGRSQRHRLGPRAGSIPRRTRTWASASADCRTGSSGRRGPRSSCSSARSRSCCSSRAPTSRA